MYLQVSLAGHILFQSFNPSCILVSNLRVPRRRHGGPDEGDGTAPVAGVFGGQPGLSSLRRLRDYHDYLHLFLHMPDDIEIYNKSPLHPQ